MCQPEDKELLEIYKKHEDRMDIKLDELPKCTNMKVYEKNPTVDYGSEYSFVH